MKSLIFFSICALFSTGIFAQEETVKSELKGLVTDTIDVSGVCGMCQERIQNAAYIKGVKKVTWDKNTQKAIVIYKADKTDILTIQNAIANAGHATGQVPANKEAYNALPGCCKYEEVEVH